MNAYTAPLGLVTLLLLLAAWRGHARGKQRHATPVSAHAPVCGVGVGALAATFTWFI